MKLPKKILKTIIAVVVVVAVVVIGLSIYKSTVKMHIITTSTLREVISISELSTGEFIYNGIVSVPKVDNPEEIDYSIKYNSTVKAGIKAEDVDFEVDEKNKTIKPILPEIVLNDISVAEGSISTIPAKTDISLKEAITACKNDAEKEANENYELKEVAKSNLKDTISAFLTPIVKDNGYTVVWD